MDQVAAKQDPVLARVENVGHVARRVPRYRTCRQVISQPIAVSDRGEQMTKTLQVRLVDKTGNGVVRDHDPAQIRKRHPTVARYQPVQMVEMRVGESDCADRGGIDARLGHGAIKMAQ
jgi:hypothetical protein